jgi:hypothetical protein
VWGSNEPNLALNNPGCTDGAAPLFPWMKQNGVGIAIWQWWSKDPSRQNAIANAVRT